ENRDCRRGDAWNTACLPQCLGPDTIQLLPDLSRQTRNSAKLKFRGDPPPLGTFQVGDLALLLRDIAGLLRLCFDSLQHTMNGHLSDRALKPLFNAFDSSLRATQPLHQSWPVFPSYHQIRELPRMEPGLVEQCPQARLLLLF